MVFGVLISHQVLDGVRASEVAFALLAVFAARPVAILPALAFTPLRRRERLTVA